MTNKTDFAVGDWVHLNRPYIDSEGTGRILLISSMDYEGAPEYKVLLYSEGRWKIRWVYDFEFSRCTPTELQEVEWTEAYLTFL